MEDNYFTVGFPCGSAGKESGCNEGDLGLIPGLGRSPGEGKGYPLQFSGLENSMDCIVHGVTKSRTWLSDFHFHYFIILWWFLPDIDRSQPWVHMCPPHPESPSCFPPHPIPLGCPRAPALSALLHELNLPCSSLLHMVIYTSQHCSLIPPHPCLLQHSSIVWTFEHAPSSFKIFHWLFERPTQISQCGYIILTIFLMSACLLSSTSQL